jgi:hypothetical protein
MRTSLQEGLTSYNDTSKESTFYKPCIYQIYINLHYVIKIFLVTPQQYSVTRKMKDLITTSSINTLLHRLLNFYIFKHEFLQIFYFDCKLNVKSVHVHVKVLIYVFFKIQILRKLNLRMLI